MNASFSIGSKCAVLLPREVINPQITPAKGLVINKLLNHTSLVLVEEVWQFKGLPDSHINEMCISFGKIKNNSWGWIPVPQLVKEEDYLIFPAKNNCLNFPNLDVFDSMIKQAIKDFFEVKKTDD